MLVSVVQCEIIASSSACLQELLVNSPSLFFFSNEHVSYSAAFSCLAGSSSWSGDRGCGCEGDNAAPLSAQEATLV